jgi:hypothetical protein
MIAVALALALATGGIAIVGDATCPAPTEVASQVAALGPAPGGDAPTAKVIVARTERTLRLSPSLEMSSPGIGLTIGDNFTWRATPMRLPKER